MLPFTFVVVTDVTHPEGVFPHDMRCPSFRCSFPPFSPFLSFCFCLFPFVSIIVALARFFPSLPYLPFFLSGGLYYLSHMRMNGVVRTTSVVRYSCVVRSILVVRKCRCCFFITSRKKSKTTLKKKKQNKFFLIVSVNADI